MKSILLILLAATLIEICPNPYGDDGAEYVMFHCNSDCILTDGEGKIESSAGMHVAAKDPAEFRRHFGLEADLSFPKGFALSNRGEEICVEDNKSRDCFYYGRDVTLLDDGIIYFKSDDGWDFRYEDWSNFSCVADVVRGRVVLSPSDYTLIGNNWSVASFTYSSPFAPKELFVDASPPSIPCRELEIQNTHFLASKSYRNFHYKFAVNGKKVVITTENWAFAKKGYIVEFESGRISKALYRLLENDAKYSSGKPTYCSEWKVAKGSGEEYKEFVANVTLFILPDCNPVLDIISSAKHRLHIIAPYVNLKWYSKEGLREAIQKAVDNGAEVRVVMDRKYASSVEELKKMGAEVILTDNLHGKAVVADDRVLVTSANMNIYGLKLNREVGIIIDSPEIADFIAESCTEQYSGFNLSGFDLLPPIAAFLISLAAFMIAKRG